MGIHGDGVAARGGLHECFFMNSSGGSEYESGG